MSKKINNAKLLASAIKELQFANLQVAHLMSVLDELDTFTGTLERAVIANAKTRHELDKLIHAKILFLSGKDGNLGKSKGKTA